MAEPKIIKFVVGQSYWARSISLHDCIFSFPILARTAKQVTIKNQNGMVGRRGIKIHDGVEQFKPFGNYSKSPIVRASRKK